MLDEKTIKALIVKAITENPADKDAAHDAAREEIHREMTEAWWEQVYASPIPWLDKVIDRDAISARIGDEVDDLLSKHFWPLWEEHGERS